MEARAGRRDREAPVADAGRSSRSPARSRSRIPRPTTSARPYTEPQMNVVNGRSLPEKRLPEEFDKPRVRGARRRREVPDRIRPAQARRDVRRQDADGRQHRADAVATEPHAPAEDRDVRAGLRQRLRADPQGLRAVLRAHRGGADRSQRPLRRPAATAGRRRDPSGRGRGVRRARGSCPASPTMPCSRGSHRARSIVRRVSTTTSWSCFATTSTASCASTRSCRRSCRT